MSQKKRSPGRLIGIKLLPDTFVFNCCSTLPLESGKLLGSLYILTENTTCSQLRKLIHKDLDGPKDFRFLSSSGLPFDVTIENKIFVEECVSSGAITVQRTHGRKFRIGVRLLDSEIVGFIFLSFSSELSHIRDIIISEISDIFEEDETFQFIDNNLWPVRLNQESELNIWDLLIKNYITIKKVKVNSVHSFKPRKKPRLFPEISRTKFKRNASNNHSILISYVHSEASTYARDLKQKLIDIGFNKVFLDIDDIPAGQDWQDVISTELNKCTAFVPLVTSRYGETRWTNREAKLADDKEKHIIPVCFVDRWPPDQLAIQFVTLQYIPWKTNDELNNIELRHSVDTTWSIKSIERVAQEIKRLCSEQDISTPDSSSFEIGLHRFASSPSFTSNSKGFVTCKEKFIVISAHPKQKHIVKEVMDILRSDDYDIWTSFDLCECDENTFSPIEDTQPLLTSPNEESCSLSDSALSHRREPNNLDFSHNVTQLKRDFRNRVKEAKLVILIFSDEYISSKICRQQLFYCEHRKKAIVIKYGEFPIDNTVLNLYPENEMIVYADWNKLKSQLKKKINSDYCYESSIRVLVSNLKKSIQVEGAVYVIGGTVSISKNASTFCIVLGTELAKVKNLILVTEGFYGVGELVGKNFCEEQDILYKGRQPNIFHILPTGEKNVTDKASQNEDGTFQKISYGTTLFYGNSIPHRDEIVAATFKICILIEGGERSASLAEKFLWNDSIVIPVLFNNRITERKCLKECCDKAPLGVQESDWNSLNEYSCPEKCAKSVKKIVCTLLNLKN